MGVKFNTPLSSLTRTHVWKELQPGERAVIFHYQVPDGHTLFIKGWGNTWHPNCKFYIYVDGELIDVLESEYGSIAYPILFRPDMYLIAKDEVKIIAENNDSIPHVLEFRILGDVYVDALAKYYFTNARRQINL